MNRTGPASNAPQLPAPGTTPDDGASRSWRLDQILLVGTVILVVAVVALAGLVQAWSTRKQFTEAAQAQTQRLETQAHEVGGMVSRLIAITSASALRDNNYAVLKDLAQSVVADNPNILRVQILDNEGHKAADTSVSKSAETARKAERLRSPSFLEGMPVFEYQEPITFAGNALPGLVVVSYSLEPLQSDLRSLEASKLSTLQRNTVQTLVVGGLLAIAAALLAALLSRRITEPLGRLSTEAFQLAQGNLDARVEATARAGREVENLGMAFNHMADRISHLLEDARAKARLEREVDLARTVQETLLPGREVLSAGPVRVAGRISAAELVAGDWWLREVVGKRLVVAVGDVTGHGLSTALIANTAVSAFANSLRNRGEETLRAGPLLTLLNQTLHAAGKGGYRMSASLAVFDLDQGEVDCAGGAHPFPYVFNRQDGNINAIVLRGPLLGERDPTEFPSRQFRLRAGDVLVWYTDGLTDARDQAGRPFGVPALSASLRLHARLPAQQLRDAVLDDVKKHSGPVHDDDITLVVAEYSPPISQQLP